MQDLIPLLELLLDTWIDEVEDQLKENTVYQGMLPLGLGIMTVLLISCLFCDAFPILFQV